ncbi:type I-MYXAN CRISPR-associated protein Cas5/Cmx5/DevS [Synechococcus elongatus]|uniref:type I-MYXAN CRISPR-associated protein Cas5/Cmx5/DevS n=1 Tax=Synechococcus elongatus TaxID=32046 RepID=UPI000F7F4A12|nr:type I-MYXAN CRISPR-associated protein Cas5/Cmx5/DevS [Synechococcus elongatus]
MPLQLYLDVPLTSFPRSYARDYKETYRFPPPSTVYGCLLSLVGEVNLERHCGVRLAIGLLGEDPVVSRILRKQRQHKFWGLGTYPAAKHNKPNFQEVVSGLELVVAVDSSQETESPSLSDRLQSALSNPAAITRFGGLSLGESWALVNGVRPWREQDGAPRWLCCDSRGLIALPVWIDRKTSQGTFGRYRLDSDWSDQCWTVIPAMTPAKAKTKKGLKQ